ncbi:MAG: argininosuccinate lyase [Clostridia bacterium]|nr:argininosuccinate lyase [Clostridia bacterium]
MEKLWSGNLHAALDPVSDEINASIRFDRRIYRQDIKGSVAHARMLGAKGIIPKADAEAIIAALKDILSEIDAGSLAIDESCEDIHSFVEMELTRRLGDVGKRLHTARSRNDQVALDFRLFLRDETQDIIGKTLALLSVLSDKAEAHRADIMPGYTHMQRAQPITMGHHLMAWAMMLTRDVGRMKDALRRMNESPLGCAALAGTTYDIDRMGPALELGFDGITKNSLEGVGDRDFAVELLSAFAMCMAHLSRFSEEIILWSSWEFRFVSIDDGYSTGSSIMPQKKNPDMAELVRGKTGRVYGDLMTMLTVLKGLPLAYNKDLQEDKEALFDAIDTLKLSLNVFAPMVATMKAHAENMRAAASGGFINATDCADYLTRKGMPFRTAYRVTGDLVNECMARHTTLEDLPLEVYKSFSDLFEDDIYENISLEACVSRRVSEGGPALASVDRQIEWVRAFIGKEENPS